MKKTIALGILLLAGFGVYAEPSPVEDAEYGYDGALIVRAGASTFHRLVLEDRWFEAGGYVQYRFATSSFAAVPHVSVGVGNAFAGVSKTLFDRMTPETLNYDFGFLYRDLKFKVSTEDFDTFTYFIGVNVPGRASTR